MSESAPQSGLAQFVRERHVHYSLSAEDVVRRETGPVHVGFDVRLFASHGGDAHAPPNCPVCRELQARLEAIARQAVQGAGDDMQVEIAPNQGELFQSHEAREEDEVALDVRLLRRGGNDQPAGQTERSRLDQVKERLRGLGIHEG
jgi:hypothetical protein